jgi:hypothetical protein
MRFMYLGADPPPEVKPKPYRMAVKPSNIDYRPGGLLDSYTTPVWELIMLSRWWRFQNSMDLAYNPITRLSHP